MNCKVFTLLGNPSVLLPYNLVLFYFFIEFDFTQLMHIHTILQINEVKKYQGLYLYKYFCNL